MHWGSFGMGWGTGLGWIFIVIFWILLILGIVYLIKYVAGSAKKEEPKETALDILKKRYASGEINKEEFDRIKDDLIKH